MLAVKTENLEMEFKMGDTTVHALRGVSLSVEEGEFVSIVGTSGSGKSTLLNLVGGLMRATGGKMYVKGEDLTKMDENKLALFRRKYIGFVFQSFNLINALTAVENVELPLIFSNVSSAEREKRVISQTSTPGALPMSSSDTSEKVPPIPASRELTVPRP